MDLTFWLVIGEYEYDAKHGNGVYVRAFQAKEAAGWHRDWLQSVAGKAKDARDDWYDYNFMVLEMDFE